MSVDARENITVENALLKLTESEIAFICDLISIKEIRKFSSLYVQTVNRGPSETINSMKAMAEDAWTQKKEISKQKGEIASQKLIIPNMIMFLGILAVVVAPMLISMLGNL